MFKFVFAGSSLPTFKELDELRQLNIIHKPFLTSFFMDYSAALAVIKSGGLVKRAHWKNVLYIFLVEGSDFEVNRAPLNKILPVGTKVRYASHIDGCYGVTEEDGNYYTQVGVWTASNGDILATDWEIVTPNA